MTRVTGMLRMLGCCSHIPLSQNMPYMLRLLRTPLLSLNLTFYSKLSIPLLFKRRGNQFAAQRSTGLKLSHVMILRSAAGGQFESMESYTKI